MLMEEIEEIGDILCIRGLHVRLAVVVRVSRRGSRDVRVRVVRGGSGGGGRRVREAP